MTITHQGPAVASTAAPRFSRLLNTEIRRLAARRFTQVLIGLSILGYLAAMIFLFASHARVTPDDIAQATLERDQAIAQMQQYTDECLSQPGQSRETCGFVPTAEQFPIDQFLAKDPFRPEMISDYSLAVGVAVALAGFLLGATFIGAEWSSRNLVAWLYFEPRRMRLLGAKLLVLCSVVLVLSIVAQAIWTLSAQLLMSNRGLPVSSLGADAEHFWSDTMQVQLRAALLVLPITLLGFGLANLIRNTAAALGVAFVYLVILENVAASISPGLQPYQFTISIAAWVSDGGITVYGDAVFDQEAGFVVPAEIHISNLNGALTILVYTAIVLAVSLTLFRRRDIT